MYLLAELQQTLETLKLVLVAGVAVPRGYLYSKEGLHLAVVGEVQFPRLLQQQQPMHISKFLRAVLLAPLQVSCWHLMIHLSYSTAEYVT